MIFCRNLLIYFDRATQDNAVRVLQRLLKAKGVLFVGPSETGLMLSHDFVSAKVPVAFAFRKIDAADVRATHAETTRAGTTRAKITGATTRTSVPSVRPAIHPSIAAVSVSPSPAFPSSAFPASAFPASALPKTSPQKPLQPVAAPGPPKLLAAMMEASALADQGHLAEAAQTCEEVMRNQGPSPQAFYLLGLIRDASGNLREAAQYYRKALYLDPDHLESLAHLAFLLEKQGDARGAQVLRNRVARTEPKRAK
jgi:chemotaxis protein methyltransferase WspC